MKFACSVLAALAPLAALSAMLAPHPASAKCMARVAARADGSTGNIVLVVPDAGSADVSAAGYTDANCAGLDKAAYRARVCNPKAIGNRGVQRQLEAQQGISFVQLCTAARAEAGLSDVAQARSARFSPSNDPHIPAKPVHGAENPLRRLSRANSAAGGQ